MSLVRGEVAEIIDEYTVVLNIGRDAGVKKGMRFVVYVETEHVFDGSGRDLGVLEIPKAEIQVTDVQEQLSLAKSTEFEEIPYLSSIYYPQELYRKIRIPLKLPVEEDKIKRIKVDLLIKKGDKVRQVP